MKIWTAGILIFVMIGIQSLYAARTGWQYHRNGAINFWKGFSLPGVQHEKNTTQLRVVDLKSDGINTYVVYFPAIHPLINVQISITSNFYTESLEYAQTVNQVLTSKKDLHGAFGQLPLKVPLSIPREYKR